MIIAGGNSESFVQALQLVRPNGVISNVNFLDPEDAFHLMDSKPKDLIKPYVLI